MDVRKVVRRIQWQSWERIIVNNHVTGKVTLSVRKVPLDSVLHIVAMQTSSRWAALYPLYSTGKSVVAFKKAIRGDMLPSESGWTNLFTAPAWRRGNTGGFANNPTNVQPRIVDLLATNVGNVLKVFECPRDQYDWFRLEGSSYEWNYAANNQLIEQPGVNGGIPITADRARLMYDYEIFISAGPMA